MRNRVICLDVETSKLPYSFPWQPQAFLVAVGIIDEFGHEKTWVFNHNEVESVNQRQLIGEIQDEINRANLIVGQNLKFDLNWLRKLGIDFSNCKLHCTMISEYILQGQAKISYHLDALCDRYQIPPKLDRVALYWEGGYETTEIPLDTLLPYLLQDCKSTLAVYHKQLPLIERKGVGKILNLHNYFQRILSHIEMNGMRADREKCLQFIAQYKVKLQEIDDEILEILGWDCNLNSNDELSVALFGGVVKRVEPEPYLTTRKVKYREPYLFIYKDGRTATKYKTRMLDEIISKVKNVNKEIPIEGLGFTPPDGSSLKKEGYYSTAKDTLTQLRGRKKNQKRLVELLLDRSEKQKALSTFIGKGESEDKGLINQIQPDGIIHPQYNQAVTITGRLSSRSPNGQNMPRKGTSHVKQIFVPRFDFILNADLSQLEWRVAAFLSQDPVMIQEIIEGVDTHTDNATRIFGDESYRQTAKVFTFRMLYGGTAYSFYADHEMPNFSLKKWDEIVATFYKKYDGLRRWQEKNIQKVYENGYLVNPSGRILTFTKEYIKKERGEGYRVQKIKNYPVQSFATADIMPLAMAHIYLRLKKHNLKSVMIGQVHDSIVFDAVKSEARLISETCMDVFNSLPQLIKQAWGCKFNVPLTGEIEYSSVSYGDMTTLPKTFFERRNK